MKKAEPAFLSAEAPTHRISLHGAPLLPPSVPAATAMDSTLHEMRECIGNIRQNFQTIQSVIKHHTSGYTGSIAQFPEAPFTEWAPEKQLQYATLHALDRFNNQTTPLMMQLYMLENRYDQPTRLLGQMEELMDAERLHRFFSANAETHADHDRFCIIPPGQEQDFSWQGLLDVVRTHAQACNLGSPVQQAILTPLDMVERDFGRLIELTRQLASQGNAAECTRLQPEAPGRTF